MLGVIDYKGMYAPYVPQYETWAKNAYFFTRGSSTWNSILTQANIPNSFIDFDSRNKANDLLSSHYTLEYSSGNTRGTDPSTVMDGLIFIPVEKATVSRY